MKKWNVHIAIYGVIVLLVFAQYGNTLSHEYTWDDAIVIVNNDRVQQGVDGIPDLFRNIKSEEIQHRYGYRPITLVTFALDISLFGMDAGSGHLMNVVWYALLCCLIFYSIKRLFPEKNTWFSLVITALFIVHPVHVEVVANIKSRDEILALLFGLLSVISFLNFLEKKRRGALYVGLTIVFLLLAFLSRENGITFIGILVLLAWYKRESARKWYFKFGIPLVLLFGVLALRSYLFSDAFFENRLDNAINEGKFWDDAFLGNPLVDASGFGEILANAFYILAQDLKLLIFPTELLHDYGYSYSEIVSWGNPWVIFSVILHGALLYVVIKRWKKPDSLVFGAFFYLITLFIYLHVVKVGPDYMAERFLFAPSLGFLIVLLSLLEKIPGVSFGRNDSPLYKSSSGKLTLGVLSFLLLLGFMKSFDRNRAWENNQTLLEMDLETTGDGARMHYNYACLLHEQYRENPSPVKQNKILRHYERSVEISTRALNPVLDLAYAYQEFGRMEEARETFELCVEKYPELSAPYIQLGKYYLSKNDFQTALVHFTKAQEKGKENVDTYYLRAVCMVMLKQNDQALSQLNVGLKFNPQTGQYFELLSDLEFHGGSKQQSFEMIQRAVDLEPTDQRLQKLKERGDLISGD